MTIKILHNMGKKVLREGVMDKNEKNSALGEHYPLTTVEEAANTRERIMLQTIMLFAKNGYEGVSMKDIADAVDLRPASLYNHFESKQALWDATLNHIEHLYQAYFARLGAAVEAAVDFDAVLSAMFVELKSVVNIFTYYSFSLVMAEQFRDVQASRITRETFLSYSIDFIRNAFDGCVEKNMVSAFDTKTAATVLMHSVLIGIEMRVQQDMGNELPYDVTQMFEDVQRFIYQATQS